MNACDREQGIGDLKFAVCFAVMVLGWRPYDWQLAVMAAVDRRGSRVALKAANGSGKTSCVAAILALWHASTFEGSLVIVTAGVFRQVKEQFFPNVHKFQGMFIGAKFLDTSIELPNGSKIYGFSTDDSHKFEGWHNENLLVICDEAKSIPDEIFEAIARCQPARLLLISSPGSSKGQFYRAFTSERHLFETFSVTAYDCPHIPEAWIEEQFEKYGKESPLVRSMIFADFSESSEEKTVLKLSDLEGCLNNPPEFEDGDVQAFADVAAGGDENVLAVRRGNRVEVVKAWHEKDTMAGVGELIRLFNQEKLIWSQVGVDASGLGLPMCDRLKEQGWNVQRVRNEKPPSDKQAYANTGAEIWFEGARKIASRQIIVPNDKLLHEQLLSRRYFVNSRGQLQLESKQQMAARGLNSPDRADAVLGALYRPRKTRVFIA